MITFCDTPTSIKREALKDTRHKSQIIIKVSGTQLDIYIRKISQSHPIVKAVTKQKVDSDSGRKVTLTDRSLSRTKYASRTKTDRIQESQ